MIGVKVWIYQIKTLMSVWVSHEPCRNTVKFEYHLINHYRNITPLAVCVDPRIYRNLHVVWLAQSAPLLNSSLVCQITYIQLWSYISGKLKSI